MSFLDFARLTRLPNVFTAMADICLVGLALDADPIHWSCFLLILCSSASLYLAGMVWNDYFDVAQDRKERPGRPLASGRVSLSTAVWLGTILLAVGVMLAALADMARGDGLWKSTIVAGLLVLAILAYDGWLKRTMAGPISMGTCRFLNILLGLSMVSQAPPAWGWMLALVIGIYITGVTWFAWTEARLSSAQELKAAAAVMLAGVLLSLAVPAMVKDVSLTPTQEDLHRVGRLVFPYLMVLFIYAIAAPVLRAIADPVPDQVQAAVKRTILGLVLFDAVLATALAGPIGLAIVLLLVPARILGRWVYST